MGGNLPLGELFGAPASCCGSEGTKVLEVGGSLNPLLNSIGKDNIPSDYWLIDSGCKLLCDQQTVLWKISVTVSWSELRMRRLLLRMALRCSFVVDVRSW